MGGRVAMWVITGGCLWSAGCALQHDFDGGIDGAVDAPDARIEFVDAPDAPDVPDAGTIVMRCGAFPAVAHPAMCDLDGRCDDAIDERPLAPAAYTLDRPSIEVDVLGRPIFLTARAEDPSIGALVTRDGTSPWIFERLTTPMVRGVFTPGVAEAQACATVFVDDGAGTTRVVEHLADGDVVVDAFAGDLEGLRSAARTREGVFALFTRAGTLRAGFRGTDTAWRDVALPASAATASLVANGDDGVSIAWMTEEGFYVGQLTSAAILRGEGVSDIVRLAALEPTPDTHFTPDYPVPQPHLEMSERAIFASDSHGNLVLSRRAADGAWTEDLVGDGSVVECGPPTEDATCLMRYATHLPLAIVTNDDGDVAGLFTSRGADAELVGGYWREPDPFEGYEGYDAGPPHGPDWLGSNCCLPASLFLVFAEAGHAPRTVLLEENTFLSDAALALGADGTLHILLRAEGGHRYIERRPHGT